MLKLIKNRVGLKKLLLLSVISGVAMIALAHGSWAGETLAPGLQWIATTYHSQRVQAALGEKEYDFKAIQYLNEHGDREVAYEFDRGWLMRFLVGQRRSVLLVGRDLDGDQKFDAWFVMGRAGVSAVVERVAAEEDGWEVASDLLQKNHASLGNRLLLDILFSNLSFTGGTVDHFFEDIDRNQIDLHDFELRTDKLVRADRGSPAAAANYRMISEEWQLLNEVIEKKQKGLWKWIALDVTFARLTTYIGKWLDKLNLWAEGRFMVLRTTNGLFRVLTEHLVGLSQKAKAAAQRARTKIGKHPHPVQELGIRAALLKMTAAERLNIMIRGLKERGKVAKMLGLGTEKLLEFGASGMANWKYITLTQSAQLAIEIHDKKDAIFTSSNPLIITRNVVTNKDLVQNVWYMTNETFLMSAAWNTVKNPVKRFGFCAVLSLVDSMAMNYLVKGVSDKSRLALDTAWELTIGNMQTAIIDQKILSYFETRAANLGNSKLRLLGYIGTLAEQSVGYAGYAALTAKKDEPKPTVRWMPVFGEKPAASTP